MVYDEVTKILKVDLFLGPMSMNWRVYSYPPPLILRTSDGSQEQREYDLRVNFQGSTNATFTEATLRSRSGRIEVWPK
jgi:hypothetical protein